MFRDVLITRFGGSDIQQSVLEHNVKDMTLEDTINLMAAKEAGKRSEDTILGKTGE